ncbi:MAG: thiamine pyrophosphate-dependent dehydrogenase E1 component subunit alpha [Bdellovibrionales bacterium]|nr:thiamine pyrophosphate-dependent dehydrogenase E1 component subunit alpha [Bdellovibrionales bacterium]
MKKDSKNGRQASRGGSTARTPAKSQSKGPAPVAMSSTKNQKKFRLPEKKLIQIHDLMVKSRVLEERLIAMYKKSDGYFWIGGPGEEAFSIPLGVQINKGFGLDHDFLHLHYRSSPIMLAMGAEPIDSMRQMKNTASDPYSGGRNFGNHYSKRDWNVVPVTSTIETQYATAIGTGIAQAKKGCKGITIVNGGDAGTAEGEFASCLVWSSRPKFELPILMIVTNNRYGISTPWDTQHGEKYVSDRGTAFGIKNAHINGNDVEESYFALQEALEYVRTERKPFLLEAEVSRLYGHSSASGANFKPNEVDCLVTFEAQLEKAGVLTRKEMTQIREKYTETMLEESKQVRQEPQPTGDTIYDNVYYGQKGKYW